MAEIINLRRAKRRLARDAAAAAAEAQRRRHGRTASEVTATRLVARQRDAVVDGAKLEGPKRD